MTSEASIKTLAAARQLAEAAASLSEAATGRAAQVTGGGASIDDHQVLCERLALLATEARAASELVAYAERLAGAGRPDALADDQAFAYAADVVNRTETAMPQAHTLLAAELVLKAQKQARTLTLKA